MDVAAAPPGVQKIVVDVRGTAGGSLDDEVEQGVLALDVRVDGSGRDAEIRFVEGAGHTLYDPGVRDAVMKAIADMASRTGK